MIKCAFFITVRMQQEFPDQPLYLFQLGTDRLEGLFSVLRTLTHNSNFDMLQCGERLSHATQISQLYQKHPDWKCPSKRLQGSQDHMNPSSWVGSSSTSDVDVVQCWFKGRIQAHRFLSATQLFSEDQLDYDTYFSTGCSMMSPCGSLVGVDLRSENENEDETELGDSEQDDGEQDDSEQDDSERSDNQRSENEQVIVENDTDEEIDIEDALPVSERAAVGFIQHEGRMMHKSSIVRILFSSDPKSHDRLRRVRGMSKHNSGTFSRNVEDECVVVGDPCCTLARVRGYVCLAVFIAESISNSSGKKVSSIAVSNLSLNNVKVAGPILVLKVTEHTGEWIWNRNLGDQLNSSGMNVQAINPDILPASSNDSHQMTYRFSQDDLSVLCEVLWSQSRDRINSIASTTSQTLPYTNSTNEPLLICFQSQSLSVLGKKTFTCKLCKKEIKAPQMRLHVGYHILNGNCTQYPCGFCGISCTCTVHLKKTSQHHKGPQSDCVYFYKFSLTSAAKHATRSPCTNIPVKCTICDQLHWKYNMAAHFQDRHHPTTLSTSFQITQEERTQVLSVGKFPKAKPQVTAELI